MALLHGRMGGLPFHHDELLHVTPFLLYRCGLLLLELIVELKFVLRLFTLAEAIVEDAHAAANHHLR